MPQRISKNVQFYFDRSVNYNPRTADRMITALSIYLSVCLSHSIQFNSASPSNQSQATYRSSGTSSALSVGAVNQSDLLSLSAQLDLWATSDDKNLSSFACDKATSTGHHLIEFKLRFNRLVRDLMTTLPNPMLLLLPSWPTLHYLLMGLLVRYDTLGKTRKRGRGGDYRDWRTDCVKETIALAFRLSDYLLLSHEMRPQPEESPEKLERLVPRISC